MIVALFHTSLFKFWDSEILFTSDDATFCQNLHFIYSNYLIHNLKSQGYTYVIMKYLFDLTYYALFSKKVVLLSIFFGNLSFR